MMFVEEEQEWDVVDDDGWWYDGSYVAVDDGGGLLCCPVMMAVVDDYDDMLYRLSVIHQPQVEVCLLSPLQSTNHWTHIRLQVSSAKRS